MIFPKFRIVFWLSGIILYIIPFILNLKYIDSELFTFLFFIVYIFLFFMYLFAEEESHFIQITIILTIISIFVFPFLNKITLQVGLKYEFNSREIVLNEFINNTSKLKNIENIEIFSFESLNRINDIRNSSDKNIFENFGINSIDYANVKSEMIRLNIMQYRKEKNAVYISMLDYPKLIYYTEPPNKRKNEINEYYNFQLNENWYAEAP